MSAKWVPMSVRDEVVNFMKNWVSKTEISLHVMLKWCSLGSSKFYRWCERYGKNNNHNSKIPRDHWLDAKEKELIVQFFIENPTEGYRRLCFNMLDKNIAYACPTTVYRVLKEAGLIEKSDRKKSKKGTGFVQPLKPHEHWHTDISYVNVSGTFYYLCSLLDGYSRTIIHFELKESMTEKEIELIIQRGVEKYPGVKPRIISDNGPQFIAKDFKEFIRAMGMDHVRTSPYYPQSNGKIERWHKEMKLVIRAKQLNNFEDASRAIDQFVHIYNTQRLHSALGYITPLDFLNGHADRIYRERRDKLEAARKDRKDKSSMTKGYQVLKEVSYSECLPNNLDLSLRF